MLVSEVKRNMSKGKNLLENADTNTIIETLVEKPVQKACKEFKSKNIETWMSSANKSNIVKNPQKRALKKDVELKKMPTFYKAGKGYAWIMLNYNSLSLENKKILFSLKDELGEDAIWFVTPTFGNTYKKILEKKGISNILTSNDIYDECFEKNQLTLMYDATLYPGRSVFIRMPIDKKTTVEDVENYYSPIIERLDNQ